MAAIPTVKVVNPKGGYIVINESDFDAEQHKLYDAKKADAAASEGSEALSAKDAGDDTDRITDSAAGRYTVEPKGGGWFDVMGYKGPVNEKSLREADAEALAAKLNAEME